VSVFRDIRKKRDARRVARLPAFAVVAGAPAAGTVTIEPEKYGLVKAADLDAELPGPNPVRDRGLALAAEGDWRAVAELVGTLSLASEQRLSLVGSLAAAAVKDDAWLSAWLAADPRSTAAMAVQINMMTLLAWEVRTSKQPQHVSREQWDGFFRILRQIPPVFERALATDPTDPAPPVAMLTAARGLQWPNDEYRELWARVWELAPHSATAIFRGFGYWQARWFGSKELCTAFVEDALSGTPLGSTATLSRLELMWAELAPDDDPERAEYFKGSEVTRAIDVSLADAAAADPDHPRLPHLRHWLAFMLRLNGRNEAALEQFRLIGGYCGAGPWNYYNDPKKTFVEFRVRTVLAAEREVAARAAEGTPEAGSPDAA
jgi:hypothetical protein